jgi:hypothetical protein
VLNPYQVRDPDYHPSTQMLTPLSAESALIYVAKNGKYLNTQAELSAGTGVNDEAVLPFEAGKKYRVRIINMSALSSTSFAHAVSRSA